MSLHKLTAGDGYTYLIRQVAAQDAVARGYGSLGDYYSQKGESPGQWIGSGAADLGVAGEVCEAQMLALFGEGRHPDADTLERAVLAAGGSQREADAASKLGRKFPVYADQPSPFRVQVADRIGDWNGSKGLPRDWPVPADVKARIRTQVATELFTGEHGRAPADAREVAGFIARQSRAQTTAVAGYDLTFSPVKSVSALWAIAPRDVADRIQAAHNAAVADVIGWLEQEAAFTRTGRDGIRQVPVRGLIGAAFTHRDSRAGDPDLHTHVAVSNKVQTLDGRWLALDGTVLHKAAVAASERYNTRLEANLQAAIGVRFAPTPADRDKRPVREIVGVDAALLDRWSSRRAAITTRQADLSAAFQHDHGRPPTPVEAIALAGQATLQTRQHKHAPRSLAAQRAAWWVDAIDVLGSEAAVRAMLSRVHTSTVRGRELSAERIESLATVLLERVAAERATWQVWHVRAEAERLLRAQPTTFIDVNDAADWLVTTALDPSRSIPVTRPEPVDEPALLRRPDGSSVYTRAGAQQYTSAAVLAAEETLVAASRRRDGHALDPQVVDVALLESAANGIDLNPGQAHLVRELAGSGARVQLAIAPAGTGKTTAMGVLARAWTDGGGQVLGLAPSATAAAVLRDELGVHADTLAKLVHAIHTGDLPHWSTRIGPSTLVIVDEAGMAGSTHLAAVTQFVLARGASVRLVADDRQLAAVGAGGVLRDIAHTAGAVTLSHVVRFTDPAEAAASLAIRGADPAGIAYYLDQHRVHVGDTATAADQAYTAWAVDRAAGRDSLLIAPTRDLVTALNGRARTDRLAHYRSPGPSVRLNDGLEASAGDTIVTRANDRRLALTPTDFVKNGDRWTITAVTDNGDLEVTHARLRIRIVLPAAYVREHVDLGYATTVHAAQGATVDTCHTVITGTETRPMLYVALSRGRTANHLYVHTSGDGDLHAAIRPETLRPLTAGDILTAILTRDGGQQSATTARRDAADLPRRLADAAARYADALTVACEHVTGTQVIDAVTRHAHTIRAHLTDSPSWPALRAALIRVAADGGDPRHELRSAVDGRTLDGVSDAAAVLACRLQTCRHDPNGPLPWLPGIPAHVAADKQWGAYLHARDQLIRTLTRQVTATAGEYTPTTAPAWARPLLNHTPALLADLAVWRAVTGVERHDRRPTGPPQTDHAAGDYQHHLERRLETVTTDRTEPALRFAATATSIDPRLLTDPYWPTLADRLAAGTRAGIDTTTLVQAAGNVGPLPDEHPAAALWWRLSRHLSPAVRTASDGSHGSPLQPDWLPALTDILGANRAEQVRTDPAWPALVAGVTNAERTGSTPTKSLQLASAGMTAPDPPHSCADTLLWRVALLSDTPPQYEPGWLPPDEPEPAEQEWVPPRDNEAYLPAAAPEPVTDMRQRPAPRRGHDHLPDPALIRRLADLNLQAQAFYSQHLRTSWVPAYLRDRLDTDLAEHRAWHPGYAPAGWTRLIDHLRNGGATDNDLLSGGLATSTSTGRLIDQFRDRLVLPLHDQTGLIIGFIGRRNPHDDAAGPKYLNTPTTPLYRKGEHLLGLHENAEAIDAGARPVIVEGPLDAIAVSLAGDGHYAGVAPLGTVLTDHHAALLLRRPNAGPQPTIFIATDPDRAGQTAAENAFAPLAARGADPHHVHLPDRTDPADLLTTRGPEALHAAIDKGIPLGNILVNHTLGRWLDLAERRGQLDYWNQHGGVPDHEWQPAIHAIGHIIATLHPDLWTDQINHAHREITRERPNTAIRSALINAVATANTDPATHPRRHSTPSQPAMTHPADPARAARLTRRSGPALTRHTPQARPGTDPSPSDTVQSPSR